MYSDFHLHFSNNQNLQHNKCFSCYNSLQYNEFIQFYTSLASDLQKRIKICFGIHPLYLSEENLFFLETLLKQDKIDAIGEIGFDFYNNSERKTIEKQTEYWNVQIEFAIQYKKPIVIHSVKATDLILKESKKLKNVPAVLFHGSKIPFSESKYLLKSGVNAFFSFGKPLLKNNKTAIECVTKLPLERLCFETDSPYQLKETEIASVYKKASEVKKIDESKVCQISESIFLNLFN